MHLRAFPAIRHPNIITHTERGRNRGSARELDSTEKRAGVTGPRLRMNNAIAECACLELAPGKRIQRPVPYRCQVGLQSAVIVNRYAGVAVRLYGLADNRPVPVGVAVEGDRRVRRIEHGGRVPISVEVNRAVPAVLNLQHRRIVGTVIDAVSAYVDRGGLARTHHVDDHRLVYRRITSSGTRAGTRTDGDRRIAAQADAVHVIRARHTVAGYYGGDESHDVTGAAGNSYVSVIPIVISVLRAIRSARYKGKGCVAVTKRGCRGRHGSRYSRGDHSYRLGQLNQSRGGNTCARGRAASHRAVA